MKPGSDEYPAFYAPYVALADDDLLEGLASSHQDGVDLFSQLSDSEAAQTYAPGKWSVKEVLQHIIDCERVFAYRAICFARGDQHQLPGFDQVAWVHDCNANQRSIQSLLDEKGLLRESTIAMFRSFTHSMLPRKGISNSKEISVQAIGFILAGHERHHYQVIRERYWPVIKEA